MVLDDLGDVETVVSNNTLLLDLFHLSAVDCLPVQSDHFLSDPPQSQMATVV